MSSFIFNIRNLKDYPEERITSNFKSCSKFSLECHFEDYSVLCNVRTNRLVIKYIAQSGMH